MENVKNILKTTARLLAADVNSFRKIILASEGGQLPTEIKEKEKILRAIEEILKTNDTSW